MNRPVPAGNVYNKSKAKNPAVRLLMSNYERQLRLLLDGLPLRHVLEVGCGEGYIIQVLGHATTASISAVDIDPGIVQFAKACCPTALLAVADGMSLPFRDRSFDLVVACETLEHVEAPERFLAEMRRVSRGYCLLSVPQEPLWRVLNVLRGAYVTSLGNTPGHVQHWSAKAFLRLLSRHFEVLQVRQPLPWTMALCSV